MKKIAYILGALLVVYFLYSYFAGGKPNPLTMSYEAKIKNIMNGMLAKPDYVKMIQTKANQSGRTFDQQLRLDAIDVYNKQGNSAIQ